MNVKISGLLYRIVIAGVLSICLATQLKIPSNSLAGFSINNSNIQQCPINVEWGVEDGYSIIYAIGIGGEKTIVQSISFDDMLLPQLSPFITLSPNGMYITFVTADNEFLTNAKLWIMNCDGTNQQLLAQFTNDLWVAPLIWSPDSKQLVYTSPITSISDPRIALWTIDISTHNRTKINNIPEVSPKLFYGDHPPVIKWTSSGLSLTDYITYPTKKTVYWFNPEISTSGNVLLDKESNDYPQYINASLPCGVSLFSQNDPEWSGIIMQTCGYSIGAKGCAVTSTAMDFRYFGVNTSPKILNSCLGGNACPLNMGIAASNCSEGKASYACSGCGQQGVNWSVVESNLNGGRPVIVELTQSGNQHFVVITSGSGSSPSGYTINDPQDGQVKNLSYYTNNGWATNSLRVFGGTPWCQQQCNIVSLPSGATKCGDEGGTCNFNGTSDVYYGANGNYVVKTGVTNTIPCTTAAFGGCDPSYGTIKSCYYKGATSGTWTADYYTTQTRWWDNNSSNYYVCSESISNPTLDKNYGSGAPCPGMNGDLWVGDYNATINFSSGNYVFWVDHDDGLKLWLNGTNIADRGSTGSTWVCPARPLNGNQNLRAMLREDYGDAKINVTWTTDTSVCDPPANFSKSSPSNGSAAISNSPTLSWTNSSRVDRYEYCIDLINNNSCDSNWINVGNVVSVNLSGLSYGTTYYWQVRAINPYSSPTEANGGLWWSFTTQSNLPGTFNKISPSNGSTSQPYNPTLTWDSSTGATEYEYCYDTTNDNACGNWTSSGANTSVGLSGLSYNTTYYWQVRASNSGGTTYADGSSTAYWSFTVLTPEQQVRVTDVWIGDGNWNHKSTFNPGDPIQWVITVANDTGGDAQIVLTYVVKGPNGEAITYWNGTVTCASGVWFWGLGGTVPMGKGGTHTFVGSGLYRETNSQATTTYFVTGPAAIPRIYIPIIIKH
jgi:hypothetical protein